MYVPLCPCHIESLLTYLDPGENAQKASTSHPAQQEGPFYIATLGDGPASPTTFLFQADCCYHAGVQGMAPIPNIHPTHLAVHGP